MVQMDNRCQHMGGAETQWTRHLQGSRDVEPLVIRQWWRCRGMNAVVDLNEGCILFGWCPFPGPFMVEPNGTGVSSEGVGEAISESLTATRLASL